MLIHVINPFPAGGTPDTVVRLIAQKMSENVGQPVVVENKTGASGMKDLLANAQPRRATLKEANIKAGSN